MIYNQLIDRKLLEKSWKDVFNGKDEQTMKASKGTDNISLKDFKNNQNQFLDQILEDLKNNQYLFNKLKGIFIAKKNGKYRLLTVPTVRDRVLHRALLYILTPIVFDYINTGVSYCGVREKVSKKDNTKKRNPLNIKKASLQIISQIKDGNFFIFESDIKGFFDYVPKEKLLTKLSGLLPDPSLNKILKDIIFFEVANIENLKNDTRSKNIQLPNQAIGMSQGSSLSPLFSNIFLSNFDKILKKNCGNKLIRYVDDFIIFGKTEDESKKFGAIAKDFLKTEGLELSEEKTDFINLKCENLEFIGLNFNRHQITCLKKESEIINKFNENTLNIKNYKKIKRILNKEIITINETEQINEKIEGWANTYRHYHMDKCFEKITNLIKNRKKKDIRLKDITNLDKIKLSPLVSIEEWQSLFKKTTTGK